MPTGVQWPMSGTIGTKIYVVGGYPATAAVANNQIYNPTTNTWSTGTAFPTPMAQGADRGCEQRTLYVFGGSSNGGSTVTNAVWAYNPTTNALDRKIRDAHGAMQHGGSSRERHRLRHRRLQRQPAEHGRKLQPDDGHLDGRNRCCWSANQRLRPGLSAPRSWPPADSPAAESQGILKAITPQLTWSLLTGDSNVFRNGACAGAIGGDLYVSDGNDNSNNAFSVNEGFNLTKNAWTTLTTMPQIATDAGPAVYNGQLFCFGGASFANAFRGTVYNNVQIYQP